jgi:glucokinase
MMIMVDGPPCNCGSFGCLEALASGPSIARRAREALVNHPESLMAVMVDHRIEEVDTAHVAEAALQGDQLARRLWEETGLYLGIGVANVVNLFNPQLIVLGGGVTRAGDLLFEPVRRYARERAMRDLIKGVEIVPAALGDDVGIVGAAAVAFAESG